MKTFHDPADDTARVTACKYCGCKLDKHQIEESLHGAMFYQDDPLSCGYVPCGPPKEKKEDAIKAYLVRIFVGNHVRLYLEWAENKDSAIKICKETWFPDQNIIKDAEAEEILARISKPICEYPAENRENQLNVLCLCPNCDDYHHKMMNEVDYFAFLRDNLVDNVPKTECQGCVDFGQSKIEQQTEDFS